MSDKVFDLRLVPDCLARLAMSHNICFLFRKNGCLGIAYLGSCMVLDLEHEIDFLERKFLGFDIEIPDDRCPSKVQDGKDDVESPANVGDG